jgi:hypothetical protein
MWKVLIFASGSWVGSLIVEDWEAGTAPPFAVSETDAKLRIDCLNAGREAAKRRDVALRLAIVDEVSGVF